MPCARIESFNPLEYIKGPQRPGTDHPEFLMRRDKNHISGPISLDGTPAFVMKIHEAEPSSIQQNYYGQTLSTIQRIVSEFNGRTSTPTQAKIQIYHSSPEVEFKNYGGPVIVLIPEIHSEKNMANYIALDQITPKQMRASHEQLLRQLYDGIGFKRYLHEGAHSVEDILCSSNTWGYFVNSLNPGKIQICPGEQRRTYAQSIILNLLLAVAVMRELQLPRTNRTNFINQAWFDIKNTLAQASKQEPSDDIVNKKLQEVYQDEFEGSINSLANLYFGSKDNLEQSSEEIEAIINDWIKEFGLEDYVEKPQATYRGLPLAFVVPKFKDEYKSLPKILREAFANLCVDFLYVLSRDRDKDILKQLTQKEKELVPMVVGMGHVGNLSNQLAKAGIPVIVLGCKGFEPARMELATNTEERARYDAKYQKKLEAVKGIVDEFRRAINQN